MNILDEIVAVKLREIEELKAVRPLDVIKQMAEGATRPERRPFRALFDAPNARVLIAEIKPRSPSEGVLIKKAPLDTADMYAKSEADVISVLTDKEYFDGSIELMQNVRSRVRQAILRKDFIIDEYQVYETALAGADAFLLIAAIVTKEKLAGLRGLGASLGLETLIEVHDEEDLEKALDAKGDVIGINNRDLKTLETDLSVTENLVNRIPAGVPCISESGIYSAEDVHRMRNSGITGILVGTSILQSADPLAKISELKKALHD